MNNDTVSEDCTNAIEIPQHRTSEIFFGQFFIDMFTARLNNKKSHSFICEVFKCFIVKHI